MAPQRFFSSLVSDTPSKHHRSVRLALTAVFAPPPYSAESLGAQLTFRHTPSAPAHVAVLRVLGDSGVGVVNWDHVGAEGSEGAAAEADEVGAEAEATRERAFPFAV